MKYLGTITDSKDLTTKEYVDGQVSGVNTSLTNHINDTNNPHDVTKTQVGLSNVENVKQYSANNPPPYPVTSVNNKTGAVTLTANDVSALPSTTTIPTMTSQLTNDSGFVTSSEIPDLSTVIYGADVSTVEATTPLNADTLEGHSASYFATATQITDLAIVASTGSYADLINKPNDNQIRAIYIGTSDPTSSTGNNGDIYIKYSS